MQAPIPQPRLQPNVPQVPVRAPRDGEPPEEPFLKRAPLTTVLIGLNVAIFTLQVWHAAYHGHPDPNGPAGGIGSLATMPSYTLHVFGANDAELTMNSGHVEALLASVFLHGSLLHLAFNMFALRQIGQFMERTVTATRMMSLYVVSGVVASLSSAFVGWFLDAGRLSVGASGAICGLIGAALVTGYRIEGPSSPVMRTMARWLLSVVIFGLVTRGLTRGRGGVDNAAHIGGAISGAVIAMLWRRGREPSPMVKLLTLASFVGLLGGTAVAVVIRDANDPALHERDPSR